jgi:hypothetical protein
MGNLTWQRRYIVLPKRDNTLDTIVGFISQDHHCKSGIVYCFTQKDAEKMADSLQVRSVRCQMLDVWWRIGWAATNSLDMCVFGPPEKGTERRLLSCQCWVGGAQTQARPMDERRYTDHMHDDCVWNGYRQARCALRDPSNHANESRGVLPADRPSSMSTALSDRYNCNTRRCDTDGHARGAGS